LGKGWQAGKGDVRVSQRPGSGNSQKAEYLARQGLSVGSIHRMLTYEFGAAPSLKRLEQLVADEAKRAERRKSGARGRGNNW
jgi:hypothetical protein